MAGLDVLNGVTFQVPRYGAHRVPRYPDVNTPTFQNQAYTPSVPPGGDERVSAIAPHPQPAQAETPEEREEAEGGL
jgi:hypothetical protein